jgi:hypothetical protein
MTEGFVAALADTLVPGGDLANSVSAPAASSLGLSWVSLRLRHAPVLAAIAAQARGEDAFRSGTEEFRTGVLQQVERSLPADFAALVTAVLTLYYEHPRVLAAFGWPSRPPQPVGHELPPFDEELLAPVKARGEIWRGENR